MDLVAVLLSFGGAIYGWRALAKSMRINGRPWWARHLAGLTLGWFALGGLLLMLDGMGFALGETESLGATGIIAGMLLVGPLGIALYVSLKASRKARVTRIKSALTGIISEVIEERDRLDSAELEERLIFTYRDTRGNVTTREVSDWMEDGVYIEGFCHEVEDIRTFRRDRIVEFLLGEELLGPAKPTEERTAKAPKSSERAMEILFTGFSSEERDDLESDAEDHGLLVRKTVTKKLTFVCAGPRAGATKLSQARAQGCTILTEDEFQAMLATGELPA